MLSMRISGICFYMNGKMDYRKFYYYNVATVTWGTRKATFSEVNLLAGLKLVVKPKLKEVEMSL